MADKLFYYSKSADKKPGHGVNEFVSEDRQYDALSHIKDWRKMLSNFYIAPFEYQDHRWNTVEHMF